MGVTRLPQTRYSAHGCRIVYCRKQPTQPLSPPVDGDFFDEHQNYTQRRKQAVGTAAVETGYRRKSKVMPVIKYGFEVPRTVACALEINVEAGNNLWA